MKKAFFAIMGFLVLGVLFVGCPNDTTDNTNTPTKFEGTWTKDTNKVIFTGSGYIVQTNNLNYRKGTFTFTDTTITLTDTHEYKNGSWVAKTFDPATFGYTLSGDTLTISGGTGNNEVYNGTWTR